MYTVCRVFNWLFTVSKDLLAQKCHQAVLYCVDMRGKGWIICIRVYTVIKQTWLILGWALVVFFEVVSRPQREENLLFRLLQERDMACVRLLTPISVRAAT